jgi:hypothetical protein
MHPKRRPRSSSSTAQHVQLMRVTSLVRKMHAWHSGSEPQAMCAMCTRSYGAKYLASGVVGLCSAGLVQAAVYCTTSGEGAVITVSLDVWRSHTSIVALAGVSDSAGVSRCASCSRRSLRCCCAL